ncbi:MAG: beta-lactamase hydrolase domain-containing protein, partial [Devosia sp.]
MWPFSNTNTSTGPRYRAVDADFAVAGQISPDDVAKLAEAGFKTILCARPDNEEP